MASPIDAGKIAGVEPVSVEGSFFRIVTERYREEVLSTAGSLQYGGRYNLPRGFGALYLGEDEQVCRAEIRRRVTDPKFLRQPLVCAEVQVTLRKVLDLSDDRVLRELGIERGDLMRVTGDEAEDYRLTREIARAARAAGFEALKVPSVTTCGSNLVVFSDRLSRSSGLELLDLRPVDW